MHLKGKTMG